MRVISNPVPTDQPYTQMHNTLDLANVPIAGVVQSSMNTVPDTVVPFDAGDVGEISSHLFDQSTLARRPKAKPKPPQPPKHAPSDSRNHPLLVTETMEAQFVGGKCFLKEHRLCKSYWTIQCWSKPPEQFTTLTEMPLKPYDIYENFFILMNQNVMALLLYFQVYHNHNTKVS